MACLFLLQELTFRQTPSLTSQMRTVSSKLPLTCSSTAPHVGIFARSMQAHIRASIATTPILPGVLPLTLGLSCSQPPHVMPSVACPARPRCKLHMLIF